MWACCTAEDGGKRPAGSNATAAVSKPIQIARKVITKKADGEVVEEEHKGAPLVRSERPVVLAGVAGPGAASDVSDDLPSGSGESESSDEEAGENEKGSSRRGHQKTGARSRKHAAGMKKMAAGKKKLAPKKTVDIDIGGEPPPPEPMNDAR